MKQAESRARPDVRDAKTLIPSAWGRLGRVCLAGLGPGPIPSGTGHPFHSICCGK